MCRKAPARSAIPSLCATAGAGAAMAKRGRRDQRWRKESRRPCRRIYSAGRSCSACPPKPGGDCTARGGLGLRRYRGETIWNRTAGTAATSGSAPSRPQHAGGRLPGHGTGTFLQAQRLRPVQHGRQRPGVVQRLVRNGCPARRRASGSEGACTGRGENHAAARFSATTAAATAIAWWRGSATRRTVPPPTPVSAAWPVSAADAAEPGHGAPIRAAVRSRQSVSRRQPSGSPWRTRAQKSMATSRSMSARVSRSPTR